MSDGMGREFAYLSSHAPNRYFIPNWGISCLLDNDDAGRKATFAIETALGYRVRDASHLYSEYKDLNDYLCGVKSKQSVHQVQPVKRTVPHRKRGAALGM